MAASIARDQSDPGTLRSRRRDGRPRPRRGRRGAARYATGPHAAAQRRQPPAPPASARQGAAARVHPHVPVIVAMRFPRARLLISRPHENRDVDERPLARLGPRRHRRRATEARRNVPGRRSRRGRQGGGRPARARLDRPPAAAAEAPPPRPPPPSPPPPPPRRRQPAPKPAPSSTRSSSSSAGGSATARRSRARCRRPSTRVKGQRGGQAGGRQILAVVQLRGEEDQGAPGPEGQRAVGLRSGSQALRARRRRQPRRVGHGQRARLGRRQAGLDGRAVGGQGRIPSTTRSRRRATRSGPTSWSCGCRTENGFRPRK